MSANYLLASLPSLSLDMPPTLTAEGFVALCEEQLGAHEAEAVRAILDDAVESAHPFVKTWRDKDTQLRNAIVVRRASKAGVDGTRWLREAEGCDLWLRDAVENAFQAGDPLDSQTAMDRLRWTIAEDLAGPDPLAGAAVFAYAVKLRITLRRARYRQEPGKERLTAIVDAAAPREFNFTDKA